MTENEKRGVEAIARSVAPSPLFVPPSLFKQLQREGVDTRDMREVRPIPIRASWQSY